MKTYNASTNGWVKDYEAWSQKVLERLKVGSYRYGDRNMESSGELSLINELSEELQDAAAYAFMLSRRLEAGRLLELATAISVYSDEVVEGQRLGVAYPPCLHLCPGLDASSVKAVIARLVWPSTKELIEQVYETGNNLWREIQEEVRRYCREPRQEPLGRADSQRSRRIFELAYALNTNGVLIRDWAYGKRL